MEGKRGGTLVALWAADTDSIDPGITYSQGGYQIVRATQKTLYRPKVDDPTRRRARPRRDRAPRSPPTAAASR